MNDDLGKLEKLHLCSTHSKTIKKNIQNLTCYYSLQDSENLNKISKELYQKCDRIVFQSLPNNSDDKNSTRKMEKIIKYFQKLNLTNTSLILSMDLKYVF